MNLYNDYDRHASAWLVELTKNRLLPPGYVDSRSISALFPDELSQYTQCHFFAGIGGWSRALQLAGWPDDLPVWTGSCPCQPFSAAGKQKGTKDERHLWPEFRRLIAKCHPPVIFGEQVASKLGRQWLSGVRTDLEDLGYAVGSADLCAAGVAAPHIRQRLYWVAHAHDAGSQRRRLPELHGCAGQRSARKSSDSSRVADANRGKRDRVSDGKGCQFDGTASGRIEGDSQPKSSRFSGGLGNSDSFGAERSRTGQCQPDAAGQAGRLADTDGGEPGDGGVQPGWEHRQLQKDGGSGFWSAYDVIPCRDNKARRIEPGTFPLAHGVPGRVGLLRGYGNAIVPQVAAEFIKAFLLTIRS